MLDYVPVDGEATTRNITARAIYDQIRARGWQSGSVSVSTCPRLRIRPFLRSNPKVARGLAARSIDFRRYDPIVAPAADFLMGGVGIEEHGRSTLDGLFAAGEVAGGVHGGNRLTNNAPPEARISDSRAGAMAAERVQRGSDGRSPTAKQVLERWQRLLGENGGDDLNLPQGPLGTGGAGRSLGIIRNREQIDHGLRFVADRRERSDGYQPKAAQDMRTCIELRSMCEVAGASLIGASVREESRAAHFLEDFPQPTEAWRDRTIRLRFEAAWEVSISAPSYNRWRIRRQVRGRPRPDGLIQHNLGEDA